MKISLPFILSTIIIGIAWVAYAVIIAVSMIPALSQTSQLSFGPQMNQEEFMELLSMISPYIVPLVISLIIMWIITLLIQAFFTTGAIGMSKDAAINGRTSFEEMINSGKKHFFNYFLLQIIYYLITLAGVVFVLPGILQINNFTDPESILPALPALLVGIGLWIIYSIIVTLVLSLTYYALVVDTLGPVNALKTGYRFFFNNKGSVVVLWLVIIAIVVALNVMGGIFTPFETLSVLWSFISTIISVVVVPAVITIWWTILYMGNTGWEIHDSESGDTLDE
ncbi:DUF7847 domain-containing protein [Methanohalobium evestigatum]|uniref:DUF7847 domain-containing protein n=1 Tax=Methanohalobium evestigatum TaxID=2322 RepID=UPI001E3EC526|nr:hypothetical protein [Methanohalobium evestigatum]